jgi:hypothetical protein
LFARAFGAVSDHARVNGLMSSRASLAPAGIA